MTDTTHEAPELLPCPFCGGDMRPSKLRLARCRTEGCYMHNFVIDLDSPQSVASWNTRSDDLVQAAVAAEQERAYNAGRKHERDLIYAFAQRMDTEGKAYAKQILAAAIREGGE